MAHVDNDLLRQARRRLRKRQRPRRARRCVRTDQCDAGRHLGDHRLGLLLACVGDARLGSRTRLERLGCLLRRPITEADIEREGQANAALGTRDVAIAVGITRADETLRKIRGAWVKEQEVHVVDRGMAEYQANLLVRFVLDDAQSVDRGVVKHPIWRKHVVC